MALFSLQGNARNITLNLLVFLGCNLLGAGTPGGVLLNMETWKS